MPLRIGKDGFTLPIELVTSTQAILARKRSGKSYTASVQAEELLRHRQQIATIDPTEPGERQRLPKVLAPIDIEQLGREIADSARHAQENPPEFLRQRIADLERAEKGTEPDNGLELAHSGRRSRSSGPRRNWQPGTRSNCERPRK